MGAQQGLGGGGLTVLWAGGRAAVCQRRPPEPAPWGGQLGGGLRRRGDLAPGRDRHGLNGPRGPAAGSAPGRRLVWTRSRCLTGPPRLMTHLEETCYGIPHTLGPILGKFLSPASPPPPPPPARFGLPRRREVP